MAIKHSDFTIQAEAYLYLEGFTMSQISEALNVPISTVSNHLMKRLYKIDPKSWRKIRRRLRSRAKDIDRVHDELWKELELYRKTYKSGESEDIDVWE